jgi:hypothetical protein
MDVVKASQWKLCRHLGGCCEVSHHAAQNCNGANNVTKGDTERTKGDTERTKGDTERTKGDTERTKGDTERTKGDTERNAPKLAKNPSLRIKPQRQLDGIFELSFSRLDGCLVFC